MTRVATPENEEFLLRVAQHVTASHVETSADALSSVASAVDSRTCITQWRGEDCDCGMAIEALLQRDGRLPATGNRLNSTHETLYC